MITAVDTSVLLDVLWEDPRFARDSEQALATASREGRLVVCEVVVAELAGQFGNVERLQDALRRAGIAYSAMGELAAATAGLSSREYRRRGSPRERIVADFLIGAHALHHADRLLTRDRGFYRGYLPDLRLFDPASA